MAMLMFNIKRVTDIISSLELGWYGEQLNKIITYESPAFSVFALMFWIFFALSYPAEYILPGITFLLFMKLMSNFLKKQQTVVKQLETGTTHIEDDCKDEKKRQFAFRRGRSRRR